MTPKHQIQLLYLTYFNRAADAEGLDYWSTRLESGEPFYVIQAAFANPQVAEAAAAYAVLSQPADFVAQAYQNLLNRLPDEGGLDYWTSRIQEDMASGSSLMEAGIGLLGAFMAAAGASPGLDANTVTAKITVANAITTAASSDSDKLLELSALHLGQDTLGQLDTQQLSALLTTIQGDPAQENQPSTPSPAPPGTSPQPVPEPDPEPQPDPGTDPITLTVSLDALFISDIKAYTFDAGKQAFTLEDDVTSSSNTLIMNFGADDKLVLQGVAAENVRVQSSGDSTQIQFDDGTGIVSQIELVGISGFFTSVDSFNQLSGSGEIIIA